MRDTFPEFYPPNPGAEAQLVRSGTVVLDANILLGLYELPVAEREQVLQVFSAMQERLWIPYQVGLEYQRNRLSVIQRVGGLYQRLTGLTGTRGAAKMLESLDGIGLPPEIEEQVRSLLPDIASDLDEVKQRFVHAIMQIEATHVVSPDTAIHEDPVRDRLDSLFSGRVGPKPEDAVRKNRLDEAQRRIAEQVPPGFKDDEKDHPESQAGDYYLWAELLQHAEEHRDDGRPYLLVTNDTKEDWYIRTAGRAVAPRPELVREFSLRNQNGYHQVTLDGLLRLAVAHLDAVVDQETVDKAASLSEIERQPVVGEQRVDDELRNHARDSVYAFESLLNAVNGIALSESTRRALQQAVAPEATWSALERAAVPESTYRMFNEWKRRGLIANKDTDRHADGSSPSREEDDER